MTDYIIAFAIVVITVAAFILGWITSASAIGKECNLLGSFYLSNTAYECKAKLKAKND